MKRSPSILFLVMILSATQGTGKAAEKDQGAEGVKIHLFLNIREEGKREPLADAWVEYMHKEELFPWYDFGFPLGTLGDQKRGSQGAMAALEGGSEEMKGREVNYSVEGFVSVPQRDRSGYRAARLRVLKQGYEPFYFKVEDPQQGQRYYREIILRRHGMVGHWPCNEGAGDVAGEPTRKANPGKISGATWAKEGERVALRFDGEDDVVDCGRSPVYEQLDAITVLLWIKPAEKVSRMEGLVGRAWRNPYAFYTLKDNGLEVSLWINDLSIDYAYITQRNVFKIGEWNMVGFSYASREDNRLRLFHNGKQVGEGNVKPTERMPKKCWLKEYRMYGPSNQRLSVGYFEGVAHFKGSIRGVRIYNHPLHEEEIEKIYEDEK